MCMSDVLGAIGALEFRSAEGSLAHDNVSFRCHPEYAYILTAPTRSDGNSHRERHSRRTGETMLSAVAIEVVPRIQLLRQSFVWGK